MATYQLDDETPKTLTEPTSEALEAKPRTVTTGPRPELEPKIGGLSI